MLTFLGNGSAFNPFRDDNGAFFCRDGTLFLIDAGSSVFKNALRGYIFDGMNKVYIILTHMHMDHCGSLSQMIMYLFYKLGIKPVIVFPEEEINILLGISGVSRDMYLHIKQKQGMLENNTVEISYVPMTHVDSLNSYAFKLSVGNKYTIYFSGDSNRIPDEILKDFLDGHIDVIYQDTCGEKILNSAHLHLDDLCRLIPKANRDRVYCMHLDPALAEENILERGFKIAKIYAHK